MPTIVVCHLGWAAVPRYVVNILGVSVRLALDEIYFAIGGLWLTQVLSAVWVSVIWYTDGLSPRALRNELQWFTARVFSPLTHTADFASVSFHNYVSAPSNKSFSIHIHIAYIIPCAWLIVALLENSGIPLQLVGCENLIWCYMWDHR